MSKTQSTYFAKRGYIQTLQGRADALERELALGAPPPDEPHPDLERDCAHRIEAAKAHDALTGAKTLEDVERQVAEIRKQHQDQCLKAQAEHESKLSELEAAKHELLGVLGQLSRLESECDQAVKESAGTLLDVAKKKYQQLALQLVGQGVEVDALTLLVTGSEATAISQGLSLEVAIPSKGLAVELPDFAVVDGFGHIITRDPQRTFAIRATAKALQEKIEGVLP
jgi:hypothetical protein